MLPFHQESVVTAMSAFQFNADDFLNAEISDDDWNRRMTLLQPLTPFVKSPLNKEVPILPQILTLKEKQETLWPREVLADAVLAIMEDKKLSRYWWHQVGKPIVTSYFPEMMTLKEINQATSHVINCITQAAFGKSAAQLRINLSN